MFDICPNLLYDEGEDGCCDIVRLKETSTRRVLREKKAYSYADLRPISRRDPSGMRPPTPDVGEAWCDWHFPDCQDMCHADYVDDLLDDCWKKIIPIQIILCLWRNKAQFELCLACCDRYASYSSPEVNDGAVCSCMDPDDREDALDRIGAPREPEGKCQDVYIR